MLRLACTGLIALLTSSAAAQPTLSDADQAAAFEAAGFAERGGEWRSKCDDPGTPSYTPGAIESVGDLNGDGLPEAVVTEGGTYCYGHTGMGYSLVSKQAAGGWRLMTSGTGIPTVLDTKGKDGWPDLEVGGPGFCFPVERWNGAEYALDRYQYDGKSCQP